MMASRAGYENERRFNLIYLCPLVWRPEKVNFAGRFIRLSKCSSGYIFTLSGGRQRKVPIGNYQFCSEAYKGVIHRQLGRMWVQVIVPLFMLWRGRHAATVVVAYDAYASGIAGLAIKILSGAKLIIEINGDDQLLESSRWDIKGKFRRFLFYVSALGADAIKVINTQQEQYLKAHYKGKKIFRFPDYAATDYFASLSSVQGEYLLSVGHPLQIKGIDILIQAFKAVSKKYPRVVLRIMGHFEGAEGEIFQGLIGGHPRIELVPPGWIEDVGVQMRDCYALVCASRREAQGRVIFEAMACKKPVVASRTHGAMDYVRDGETGLICEIGSWNDLAAKLDIILSNPQMAQQMGEAGHRLVKDELSECAYIDHFVSMIQEVVEDHS